MKWILFMMLFSTPAAEVSSADKTCLKLFKLTQIDQIIDCRPKFEKNRVWSLQTTSQMQFSHFVGCFSRLDEFIADTNVAATMTIRGWCTCDDPDEKKCPQDNDPQINTFIERLRVCETKADASCRALLSSDVDKYLANMQSASADDTQPAAGPSEGERPARAPARKKETPSQSGTGSSTIRAYPRLKQN